MVDNFSREKVSKDSWLRFGHASDELLYLMTSLQLGINDNRNQYHDLLALD